VYHPPPPKLDRAAKNFYSVINRCAPQVSKETSLYFVAQKAGKKGVLKIFVRGSVRSMFNPKFVVFSQPITLVSSYPGVPKKV